jgi:high-affinity nickel-transport protein
VSTHDLTLEHPRTGRRDVLLLSSAVAVLLALGWGAFALIVLPGQYSVGQGGIFGFGLAATAFLLGVRHAFDPDHVAAIDNVTRKLMADGTPSPTVGFWFALGHSTVVVSTVLLLTAGISALSAEVRSEDSTLHSVTAVWGPAMAGLFLIVIGLMNIRPLLGLLRLRRHGHGEADAAELDAVLAGRGLLSRILSPLTRAVDRPWKMYPIGLLFGLGFDTASTVALLVLGAATAPSAPWFVVLVIPVLFTAGMVTFDAANGAAMDGAYRWAHRRPRRRLMYNLVVTGLSVVLALGVGLLSTSTALAEALRTDTGILGALSSVDLEYAGFIVVGLFGLIWTVAFLRSRRRALRVAG